MSQCPIPSLPGRKSCQLHPGPEPERLASPGAPPGSLWGPLTVGCALCRALCLLCGQLAFLYCAAKSSKFVFLSCELGQYSQRPHCSGEQPSDLISPVPSSPHPWLTLRPLLFCSPVGSRGGRAPSRHPAPTSASRVAGAVGGGRLAVPRPYFLAHWRP